MRNRTRMAVLVLGLSLFLFVGCKTNQAKPENPSPPTQDTGEKMLENQNANDGSIGFDISIYQVL